MLVDQAPFDAFECVVFPRVRIHASRYLSNFLFLISLLFCFTWRLREGRVRVIHCFSFRILLHTSLLQDVPAYPVTTSFIVVFGYKGTQSRQGNTDRLFLWFVRVSFTLFPASIRTCGIHSSRVVRSLGRIALVTYLVFGSEFWFDFSSRV